MQVGDEGELVGLFLQLSTCFCGSTPHLQPLAVSACVMCSLLTPNQPAEAAEHDLVIKQLEPMDKSRKCFRLIGDVLVERTVAETLPAGAGGIVCTAAASV